jgi:methylphosphotriester-DNA--protein-cysteine methyltransferase
MTAKEAMQQGYVPCLRCMRKYLDVAQANSDEDDGDEEVTAKKSSAEANQEHGSQP